MKIGIVSSIKVMNIFIVYRSSLLTTYNDIVFMYSEHTGSIFIFLNRPLQESLMFEFVMIPIIFSEFRIL